MLDFDIKHFTKTFNSNNYYDNNLNGFDVMIMQNHQDADTIIKTAIDYFESGYPLSKIEQYINNNLNNLLEPDQDRVIESIKRYIH